MYSEDFNIENQFLKYLNLVNIKKEEMPANMLTELRRAFYGATGQILFLMTEELPKQPDQIAENTITEMIDQCGKFWIAENQK